VTQVNRILEEAIAYFWEICHGAHHLVSMSFEKICIFISVSFEDEIGRLILKTLEFSVFSRLIEVHGNIIPFGAQFLPEGFIVIFLPG
jgi:hypothetical protein